ncbi:related to lustrin A [Claviceps purpurea 20.1]|uniref:Related to lustrin A n=1 Tax=Claviceps purpurea (strain 20.1) TaxID=1111077 RepID=M1VY13_CLAP2|nr:hypothetical protein E4U10_002965 [Claviceps purpurea]KAG6255015.1 hypothetical protein E4U49_007208 [Claviceps purpurea]CCE26866.1 related to lustrin A [Claviceps purpurea 20.1]
MKTTVTLAMMAAVASAVNPGKHMYFRRNATEPMTTLVVKTTQLHTIVSCAPTVTNCPAHATGIATLPDSEKITKVVTDTVILATTVCPVTDIAKASSSAINSAQSSNNPAQVTGTNTPSAPPALTTEVTDVVTDKTYTITMGTGSDASLATRTVRTTLKKTVTVPYADVTAAPTSTADTTTTAWATKKVTKTVKISKARTSTTAGSQPTGSGSGDCPVSTVTVTVAAPTVYVTVGGASCTADQKPVSTNEPTSSQPPVDTQKPSSQPSPTDCDDDTVPTQKATPTLAPYPTGNGTHPTSGRVKPTGFAIIHR